jgi:hypothetical protein
LHARYNAEPGEPSGWFAAIVINKRMVSGEPAYLVRWEDNIERWLTEKDLRPNNMGDTLRSILTRLAAYVGLVVAAGLVFLAAMSVYQMMWPKPVVPFGQMGP